MRLLITFSGTGSSGISFTSSSLRLLLSTTACDKPQGIVSNSGDNMSETKIGPRLAQMYTSDFALKVY